MGLNVENPVCVNGSSTPDQLNDLMNLLIKRARVINLNEVTFYCNPQKLFLSCYLHIQKKGAITQEN